MGLAHITNTSFPGLRLCEMGSFLMTHDPWVAMVQLEVSIIHMDTGNKTLWTFFQGNEKACLAGSEGSIASSQGKII